MDDEQVTLGDIVLVTLKLLAGALALGIVLEQLIPK